MAKMQVTSGMATPVFLHERARGGDLEVRDKEIAAWESIDFSDSHKSTSNNNATE
jgi:hypothetical protein